MSRACAHAPRPRAPAPAVPGEDVLLRMVAVLLAARDRGDLLDLEARRRVFQHVSAYPGIHLSEIARALGMDTNHAKYHLQYLERHGLVSSRREGAYLVFFPKERGTLGPRDVVDAADKEALALLRRPVPLHVTLVLLDRGEAGLVELAEAVDVAPSTLHYHVGRMEKAGIVASRREGKERRFHLVEHARILALLVRYKPPDALVRGFLEAWEQLSFE